MCLNKITKKIEKSTKKVTTAWKVFYQRADTKELTHYYYSWKGVIKRGRWLKAQEEVVSTSNYLDKYTTGFHCYINQEQALKFHGDDLRNNYVVLLEVKVKEITTYGIQWESSPCETIVARQMLVPKQ